MLKARIGVCNAGEAGAGFSVVAEEVRNLAICAANAAKDTSVLIEQTMKRVREGSEFAKKNSDVFSEAIANSGKVARLLGKIATTSIKQFNRVEQINKAIHGVNRITQHNLEDAERTASVSEKLNYGSDKMKESSEHLSKLASNKNN